MSKREEPVPGRPAADRATTDSAFDTWLQRSLHKLYDEVAREPIPEELLKLIEEHAKK